MGIIVILPWILGEIAQFTMPKSLATLKKTLYHLSYGDKWVLTNLRSLNRCWWFHCYSQSKTIWQNLCQDYSINMDQTTIYFIYHGKNSLSVRGVKSITSINLWLWGGNNNFDCHSKWQNINARYGFQRYKRNTNKKRLSLVSVFNQIHGWMKLWWWFGSKIF